MGINPQDIKDLFWNQPSSDIPKVTIKSFYVKLQQTTGKRVLLMKLHPSKVCDLTLRDSFTIELFRILLNFSS